MLSYLRAADVEQGSLYDGYTCRNLTDAGALARINHNGVVGEDVVMVIPLVECRPVIAANQQGELCFRIVLADGLQRVPGIGRLVQA